MEKDIDSLENFLTLFNTTDDQDWSDIGYKTCKKITAKYKNEDWNVFLDSIAKLNNEMFLGIIEIMPLIPEHFHKHILAILLEHAKGESWFAAFIEYSKIFEDISTHSNPIPGGLNIIESFKVQFVAWVKFQPIKDEDFNSYYYRYRHLISQEVQHFYESLKKGT